jgi:hypothetical protein
MLFGLWSAMVFPHQLYQWFHPTDIAQLWWKGWGSVCHHRPCPYWQGNATVRTRAWLARTKEYLGGWKTPNTLINEEGMFLSKLRNQLNKGLKVKFSQYASDYRMMLEEIKLHGLGFILKVNVVRLQTEYLFFYAWSQIKSGHHGPKSSLDTISKESLLIQLNLPRPLLWSYCSLRWLSKT